MSAMLHRTFYDGRHRAHDPYGYRSERDEDGQLLHPRQLAAVPEEAEVVRRIWRELQHRSFDAVTRVLNADGLRTRDGHVWTRDAVKDVWRPIARPWPRFAPARVPATSPDPSGTTRSVA
jgi:hypothetical protein